MLMSPKKEAEKKEEEESENDLTAEQLAAALGLEADEEMRVVGLYGDIDERKSRETLSGLLVLHNSGKSGDEGEEVWEPMEFIISTYGGSAGSFAPRSLPISEPIAEYIAPSRLARGAAARKPVCITVFG